MNTYQLALSHRVNITLFAVNHTSRSILTSEEFNRELSGIVEQIIGQFDVFTFDRIVLHPVPPTPPTPISTDTILLILYIVVGTLGGLVIFIVLLFCIIFCCLNRYRYMYIIIFRQYSFVHV